MAAYAVSRADMSTTPDELLAYAKKHPVACKTPKRVYLPQDLPTTKNGNAGAESESWYCELRLRNIKNGITVSGWV